MFFFLCKKKDESKSVVLYYNDLEKCTIKQSSYENYVNVFPL